MDQKDHFQHARKTLIQGVVKGWQCFYWLLKILVPVSFFAFVLDASGLLAKCDFILVPVMNLLHLPAAAAVPLLMGICTGTAGTVAAMTAISFTHEQMTLIAIFSLISHNMIQEGIIQAKSGSSFFRSVIIRLITSVTTVWILSRFWGASDQNSVVEVISNPQSLSFQQLLVSWFIDTLILSAIVFAIILLMNIIFAFMKTYSLIDRMNAMARPFLRVFGLDSEVGVLWLTTSFIGLAYGGALIVQEVKTQHYSDKALNCLHLSAGVNHAIIEEPLMFLPLGIHPVMLWGPRLIAAAAVVYLYRFGSFLYGKLFYNKACLKLL